VGQDIGLDEGRKRDLNSVREQICAMREQFDHLFTALDPSRDLSSDILLKLKKETSDLLEAFTRLIKKHDLPTDISVSDSQLKSQCTAFGDLIPDNSVETINKQGVKLSELQQFVTNLHTVDDAMITMDINGIVTSLNKEAQGLTGWSEAQAVGHPIMDVFHLVDEATGLCRYSVDEGFRDGTITGLKKYGVLTSRDGRKFVIACTHAPIHDEAGRMICMILILRDMTEKAQLERELFQQRENYQAIFNTVPVRIWYFDVKGIVLHVNDAALRYVGLSREQVIGKKFHVFFPLDAQVLMARHQEVISSGKAAFGLLESITSPNGQLRWMRIDRIPFKNKEGQIEGVIVLVDDITERKQRDDALRESQRTLLTLMSNLPGMAYRCLCDKNWTMMFVSEGCFKLTEYQPNDLIQNQKISYTQIIHPDDREWGFRYIQSALEQRLSFHCKYRIITASGKEKWVLEQGCGVYGPDGSIEAIEGFITDISDRLRAQEALHASESFLRSIFASMADTVFCFDTQGRFVLYNIPPDKKKFLPSISFTGKKPQDVFPPHVAKLFMDGFERNRSNQVASADFFVERENAQAWLSSKIAPIFLDGEFKGSVAVVRDISERKKMEQALAESEERYRSFVHSFHGIAYRSDETFKPCFVHGEVLSITGYSAEEFMIGFIKWDKILHPEDLPGILSKIKKFTDGIYDMFEEEYRIIRKDGHVRWVREIIHRLKDSVLGETYFQGVVYDITEAKRVETELNEYREKMIRSEHMASLGTLGSAIAHQLNQPLTAIRLFLQQSVRAMDKNASAESVKEKIQDSLVEISNATTMINRFLRYTHLQPEALRQKVSLAAVANKIVTVMSDRARNAKMVLILDGLDKLPEIEGNEGEIEQIFFILLQNAIQAVEVDKPSRLEISASIQDNLITLKFADTCSGIAPENLPKIFEPFFTTKTDGQGTGLGLCILNRILTRYGGKVDVQSQLGVGTTFWVMLPVQ
jgi:PAS domain S-box-containing protein